MSVLRHIRALLPGERLLYFADSGFVPYGDKPEQFVIERSLAIAAFFRRYSVKALVVPCNTATAAAIKALREVYPHLPVVGVEPGLKPAAALSKSKIVGVLATRNTLASAKFDALRERIGAETGVRFVLQACRGLADQVEAGELDSAATLDMIECYTTAPIQQGADVLVLGCTHYVFVQTHIEDAARRAANQPVAIVDTGAAVARQLERRLVELDLGCPPSQTGDLQAFTTGDPRMLGAAFSNLLQLDPAVNPVTLDEGQAA